MGDVRRGGGGASQSGGDFLDFSVKSLGEIRAAKKKKKKKKTTTSALSNEDIKTKNEGTILNLFYHYIFLDLLKMKILT